MGTIADNIEIQEHTMNRDECIMVGEGQRDAFVRTYHKWGLMHHDWRGIIKGCITAAPSWRGNVADNIEIQEHMMNRERHHGFTVGEGQRDASFVRTYHEWGLMHHDS